MTMEEILMGVPSRPQQQDGNNILGMLMSYISQGQGGQSAGQTRGIQIPNLNIRESPYERLAAQKRIQDEQARELAGQADTVFGSPGQEPFEGRGPLIPKPGTGLFAQDLSPSMKAMLERSKEMLASGNPALQDEALNTLNRFSDYNQAMDVAAFKESLGDRPVTFEEYNSWSPEQQQAYDKFKGHGSLVNINMGKAEEPYKPSDAGNIVDSKGNAVNIPAGLTPSEARAAGLYYGKRPEAEESSKIADISLAKDLITRVQRLRQQGASVRGFSGLAQQYRGSGGITGAVVSETLDFAGKKFRAEDTELHSNTTSLKNRVIKALTGAAMSQGEAERIMNELPIDGQPDDIFDTNLQLTIKNLGFLEKRIQEQRGRSDFGQTISPKVATVESGGDPNAVGYAADSQGRRAEGLMQIMPHVAANPGLGMAPIDVSNSTPEEQRLWSSDYIDRLTKHFNGNRQLAIEAYRHGLGTIERNGNKPPNNDWSYSYKVMQAEPAKIKLKLEDAKKLNPSEYLKAYKEGRL